MRHWIPGCITLLALTTLACQTIAPTRPVDPLLSLELVEPIELDIYEYDVHILRDTWGVPHIFGKTDADAAYGLAYAHCEDDFATIQDLLLSTRAMGGIVNGPDAAQIDYMVHLLGIWKDVDEKYETDLSDRTRAICEAYAAGVNRYAALHPDAVALDALYPVSGKDIVAGFVFRSPFFYGLDATILELLGPERKRKVSTKRASVLNFDPTTVFAATQKFFSQGLPTGSNTFSVGPTRTADGSTFLNVNSHQPWEGPVTWYEAHVHSEEGWDMVGGTFPGAPLILLGHNRDLGWAHTVNKPDLADVYVLEMNPDNPNQYRFDGEWLDLEVDIAHLRVKVNEDSDLTMPVNREILRSVHGPVLRTEHGVYAIRYAGMGDIRQVEQWYRMNRATTMDEWLDAMKMRAIPSLNCGYADKVGNILYLYNALLPLRHEGYNWQDYLPGNTSEVLWNEYLPFEKLPMVVNPHSGFVQNCNSTPFRTTTGPDNPSVHDYPRSFGIETHMTNRALRAMELLGVDPSITLDEFYAYKYDMKYAKDSFVGRNVRRILEAPEPQDSYLRQAIEVLRKWDLGTDPDNQGAALGVMTLRELNNPISDPSIEQLMEHLSKATDLLLRNFGRLDIPWKEVNRIRRGDLEMGLGGGPDILHAIYGRASGDDPRLFGRAGDCYVLLVRWAPDGSVSSRSIHQYGSATLDESSPHYADQVPLFVARQTKPVWFDEADIRAHLEREYRPGVETE